MHLPERVETRERDLSVSAPDPSAVPAVPFWVLSASRGPVAQFEFPAAIESLPVRRAEADLRTAARSAQHLSATDAAEPAAARAGRAQPQ